MNYGVASIIRPPYNLVANSVFSLYNPQPTEERCEIAIRRPRLGFKLKTAFT